MKKVLIIIALILILVGAGIYANLIPLPFDLLGGGEYHTGFSMEDINYGKTLHNKWGCYEWIDGSGCWYGNSVQEYGELIYSPSYNAPIVTSMKKGEGERSIEVVCYGNVIYAGIFFNPFFQKYWTATTGWYEVDIKYSPVGTWHKVINTGNGQVDEDIIAFVTGTKTKQTYNVKEFGTILPGLPANNIFEYRALDPIGFCIKGPQTGIIRVRQQTEFTALGGILRETHTTSEDYSFLICGDGDVEKVDAQDRYIAGEDTVKFRVDTGYSGYTQGGEYKSRGWELKIYDNKGDLVKTWKIDDDKQNARYDKNGNLLDYPIPADAVTPGITHRWSAILTNTLFNQDYEIFFAVTKEELAQAPDIEPITFSQDEYRLGETVTVYLEGIPNPSGRNNIDGFLVSIIYGTDGVDFVEDYNYKYISATGTNAIIIFKPSKADTYITVEAWAFDAPEDQGGIMSEGEMAQVWIKDKESAPIKLDWMGIIIALVIIAIFAILALVLPIPLQFKIVVIIIGIIIAIVVYGYFYLF